MLHQGFGFVTFANTFSADRARDSLDGLVVEKRRIEVCSMICLNESTRTNYFFSG